MIKTGALVMGVVMAGITTGTYFGLETLPPGAIPPPIGRVAAAEQPPVKAPEPVAVASAAAPASQPDEPAAAEQAPTEQELAEDPAPPEPAPAADNKVEQADAAAAETEPAAAPPPAPAPAPTQAAAPAPKPQAAPAKAAPAPAPAEPARSEPAKAPPEKTEVVSAAPANAPPKPAADAIKQWWPDPSKMPANQLKLQYAGQVKDQAAIALLFSAPLKLESMQQFAQVKKANGEAVEAKWTAGKNPALAVLNGLEPGRYTVILQPQIADQKGFMLGVTLKGPVYVNPP
jgi:hypothetical protein